MSGINRRMKNWKALTAAVVLAVGFLAVPQGAGATTAVSGTGTSIVVGGTTYNISYNADGADGADASGEYATAIGIKARAIGYNSVAIGDCALASGKEAGTGRIGYTTAIGADAEATGSYATAVGTTSVASGNYATAIGSDATATGDLATAVGEGANASFDSATAIGSSAEASAWAISLGSIAVASGQQAIAIGVNSEASGDASVASGYSAKATGIYSMAIGTWAQATFTEVTDPEDPKGVTIAIGYVSRASGNFSTAFGSYSKATGYASIAFGSYAEATDFQAIAIGPVAVASGDSAVAVGKGAKATGYESLALGIYAKTYEEVTEDGEKKTVTGDGGVAVGPRSIASGYLSATFGYSSKASGERSVTLGDFSQATNKYALATGYMTYATGENSSAFGSLSMAGAENSLAVGAYSTATGTNSMALGDYAYTTANNAVAIGYQAVNTTANTVSFGHKKDEFSGWYKNSKGNLSRTQTSDYNVAVNYTSDSFATLTNVAAGTKTHDAAIWDQLVDAKATKDTSGAITGNTAYEFGDDGTVTVLTNGGDVAFKLKLAAATAGDITDGNTGYVTGGTVYSYLSPAANGSYIKTGATNNTAANLTALDKAIGAVDKDYTFIKTSVNANDPTKNVSIAQNLINLDQGITQLISYDKDKKILSIGGGEDIAKDATVSVGNRKITNLADGTADTDAVNLKQLKAYQQAAIEATTYYGSDTISVAKENNKNVIRVKNMAMSETWETEDEPTADTTATGAYAFAIGGGSSASGKKSIVLGLEANASEEDSMAFGAWAQATAVDAIAIGCKTEASGEGSVAVGRGATAQVLLSSAFGYKSQATNQGAVALGAFAEAANQVATAVGNLAYASNVGTAAFGYLSHATGLYASSFGVLSTAEGTGATAIGYQAVANTSIAQEGSNYVKTVSFGHQSGDQYYYVDKDGNHVTAEYDTAVLSRLTNVAAGTKTHEAAIWDQLVKAQATETDTTTGKVTKVTPYTFNESGLATILTNDGGIAFQLQLPSGTISDKDHPSGDSGYVKGSELYTELRNNVKGNNSDISSTNTTAANLTALDTAIGNVKLNNTTYTFKKGDDATKKIMYADGKTTAFTIKIEGLGEGGGGGTTYTGENGIEINNDNDTISVKLADNSGLKADTNGLAVNLATNSGLQTDANGLAVKLADNGGLKVDANGLAVKTDGKVEKGNTGIVTGGTVYDALQAMDDRTAELTDNINKVGAGAAALAALRPEGFSPTDRWSFAVGFGHYKNANAGALGAFFKPNSDMTVSLGGTLGNGDPMMNAGISFKLGSKGKKAGTYQNLVDLVQRMDALEAAGAKRDFALAKHDKEIQTLHMNDRTQSKEISTHTKEIAALKADIARLQQQIATLLSENGKAIR